MNPELAAADLFTSCLTTPIKMALRGFVMTNDLGHLAPEVKLEQLEKIPGQFGDRRTMLGELNWIFTAITDTIAWNTLPRETFQKLFRQDLLVASLFRNFLLAERIMKANDCTPISQPKLPDTHQHQMWTAWDLALDICLSQLQGILEEDKTYVPSSFFEEQLTAFEVWGAQGSEDRAPPEQLPIVLQVLLSQAHRLRALDLLGRFLDLGPWAVNLALSVGIFPYVLKLLQSSARELRPLLVFIWAKILAVDSSCQQDLVRDQSHKYFLTVLQDPTMLPQHKTWAVFVLASVVKGFRAGQDEAVAGNLISICLNEMEEGEPVLKQWLAICLGRLWDRHEDARWRAARCNAPESLEVLLGDPNPEVRAAAVYALGTFLNSCSERTEHANSLDQTIATKLLGRLLDDGSPLVRRELVVALQWVVNSFMPNFTAVLRAVGEEEEGISTSSMLGSPRVVRSRVGGGGTMPRVNSEDKLARQHRKSLATPPSGPMMSSSATDLDRAAVDTAGKRSRKSFIAPGIVSLGQGSNQGSNQAPLSLSSLATMAAYGPEVTKKFKPFYTRVIGGLMVLEKDTDPNTADMAKSVLDTVWSRMASQDRERQNSVFRSFSQADVHSSVSAPSSPQARASFLLGGKSPPSSHNTTLPAVLHSSTPLHSHSTLQSSSHASLPPPTSLSSSMLAPGDLRQSLGRNSTVTAISEEGEGECGLSTQFIDWSARYFSTRLMRLPGCEDSDGESGEYWKREWWRDRNERVMTRA